MLWYTTISRISRPLCPFWRKRNTNVTVMWHWKRMSVPYLIPHTIFVIISQYLKSAEFGLFKRPPWEPIGLKQHMRVKNYEITVNLSQSFRIWFVMLCHVMLEENECPLPYSLHATYSMVFEPPLLVSFLMIVRLYLTKAWPQVHLCLSTHVPQRLPCCVPHASFCCAYKGSYQLVMPC